MRPCFSPTAWQNSVPISEPKSRRRPHWKSVRRHPSDRGLGLGSDADTFDCPKIRHSSQHGQVHTIHQNTSNASGVLELLKLSDVEGFPLEHRLLVDLLDLLTILGDEVGLDLRFFQQDLKKL